MSRLLILPFGIAVAALVWFWGSGGFDQLSAFAAGEQRDFQNQIARSLRALRGGQAGAFGLFLTVCFAYGFFHAVGPGHGKVLIGGYGLGRQVPWLRLAAISLASSLGQALTAIALVYAGVWMFSLTREHMIGAVEGIMAPASYAAIAVIGGWLVWRGARRLVAPADPHRGHEHRHDETCGHRHGPSMEEASRISSFHEALVLIGGIAIRPCTGALFVLIITWQMGIALAGIAGALAMGLGTAAVTIAIGLAATSLRGGLVGALSDSPLATRILPMVEVVAGALVCAIATGLLLRALP